MKIITMIGAVLFLAISQVVAQIPDNHVVAIIKLINTDNSAYANSPVAVKGKKSQAQKNGKTDSNGQVKFFLPINDVYTIHCGEKTSQKELSVANTPYVTYQIQAYTHPHLIYDFTYINRAGAAIPNEEITVTSLVTSKKYQKTTDNQGKATFELLPNETYKVSSKYTPSIIEFKPKAGVENGIYTATCVGVGTVEKERQVVEKNRQDSINLAQERQWALDAIKMEKENKVRDSIERARVIRLKIPGNVVFFAKSTQHTFVGGITIYDGGKSGEKLGTLNSIWSCSSGPTCAKAEVTVKKTTGKYKYYAVAGNGRMWQGEYEVVGDQEARVMFLID